MPSLFVSYYGNERSFLMSTENVKPAKEKIDPVVRRAITVLVVGALVPLLDSTMMNVAIHTVAVEMKATISTVQWVATAYILAMGMTLPISGWATKRFGCKPSYIFSLVIFFSALYSPCCHGTSEA
jgi:MFS family permease